MCRERIWDTMGRLSPVSEGGGASDYLYDTIVREQSGACNMNLSVLAKAKMRVVRQGKKETAGSGWVC